LEPLALNAVKWLPNATGLFVYKADLGTNFVTRILGEGDARNHWLEQYEIDQVIPCH